VTAGGGFSSPCLLGGFLAFALLCVWRVGMAQPLIVPPPPHPPHRHIPPPQGKPGNPLRALLFDAYHDEYRGVVTLVTVVDGCLTAGDKLVSSATGQEYDANEVRWVAYIAASWFSFRV
jgi:hypothetical protein